MPTTTTTTKTTTTTTTNKAVSNRWTGLLEWTTGMDYWNGL